MKNLIKKIVKAVKKFILYSMAALFFGTLGLMTAAVLLDDKAVQRYEAERAEAKQERDQRMLLKKQQKEQKEMLCKELDLNHQKAVQLMQSQNDRINKYLEAGYSYTEIHSLVPKEETDYSREALQDATKAMNDNKCTFSKRY